MAHHGPTAVGRSVELQSKLFDPALANGQGDVEEIAVEHQQQGDDAEGDAGNLDGARHRNDADRAEHDGDLEESLRVVEAGHLVFGAVALFLVAMGLLQQLFLTLAARAGVVLVARGRFFCSRRGAPVCWRAPRPAGWD